MKNESLAVRLADYVHGFRVRWEDEKGYEKFEDYANTVKAHVESQGAEFVSLEQKGRSFVLKFRAEGKTTACSVSMTGFTITDDVEAETATKEQAKKAQQDMQEQYKARFLENPAAYWGATANLLNKSANFKLSTGVKKGTLCGVNDEGLLTLRFGRNDYRGFSGQTAQTIINCLKNK